MDRETNPEELIICHTEDGSSKVSLYAKDGTVWMTQAQMGSLFGISKSSVSEHVSHVLADKERQKEAAFGNPEQLLKIQAISFCLYL